MPVQSITARAGDPQQQADGTWRGVCDVVMTDGRTSLHRITALTLDDWNAKLLAAEATMQSIYEKADAAEGVSQDVVVEDGFKEATKPKLAAAYIRAAMQLGDPLSAYLKLDRFNEYRLANGWNANQVKTVLVNSGGMTEEEVDAAAARYQYLSNPSRVTSMVAYKEVMDGDTWGAEYR